MTTHTPGIDDCCGDIIATAVEHVMDDLSDGLADPEFKAWVAHEVWAALVEHIEALHQLADHDDDHELVRTMRAIETPTTPAEVHQLHLVD